MAAISLHLAFGTSVVDRILSRSRVFRSGYFPIEGCTCCLLVGNQPQIANTQGQSCQDVPADEAEMQAEQTPAVAVHHLLGSANRFIGWDILATLTLGIGNLWLVPYKQAASAAFYREVSGTEYMTAAQDPVYYTGAEGEVQ